MRIIKGKGDSIGGKSTLNKQKIIVVNSLKPMEHRLKTLALTFLDFNFEGVYLVPFLRKLIEDSRSLDL